MNFQNIRLFWKAARQTLEGYDFAEGGGLSLLHRSENVVFLVSAPTGESLAVLRVSRPGYHTLEEIRAEIRWLDRLQCEREEGNLSTVKTVEVIRNREGEALTLVMVEGQLFVCLLFEYLEGTPPDLFNDETAVLNFYEIGKIAACLHRQTGEWQESRRLCRRCWDYENMLGPYGLFGDWRRTKELNSQEFDLLEWICLVIKGCLEQYGKNEKNYGLIHGDLRAANLIGGNGPDSPSLQVIDFDDCGFGWHMYDLAASVSFVEREARVTQWVKAWLDGYQTILPLEAADLRMVPVFIMARRIQLLAWITSHEDSDLVKELYPGFARGTVELAVQYGDKLSGRI